MKEVCTVHTKNKISIFQDFNKFIRFEMLLLPSIRHGYCLKMSILHLFCFMIYAMKKSIFEQIEYAPLA